MTNDYYDRCLGNHAECIDYCPNRSSICSYYDRFKEESSKKIEGKLETIVEGELKDENRIK